MSIVFHCISIFVGVAVLIAAVPFALIFATSLYRDICFWTDSHLANKEFVPVPVAVKAQSKKRSSKSKASAAKAKPKARKITQTSMFNQEGGAV